MTMTIVSIMGGVRFWGSQVGRRIPSGSGSHTRRKDRKKRKKTTFKP
jgi:hypothetical protein